MKNLLIKEYKISINKFFIYSGFLFSAMLLIPNWIYVVAFMYVFWLIVPGIYSEYNTQNDFTFMDALPVSKKDIVKTKILALAFIEITHIIVAVFFANINSLFFGTDKIFFDLNFAFFGNIFIMYAIFNVIFFPLYFKTAFFYGKAAILGSLIAILYASAIEILNLFVEPINVILESDDHIITQVFIFMIGVIVFVGTLLYVSKVSIKCFENKQ